MSFLVTYLLKEKSLFVTCILIKKTKKKTSFKKTWKKTTFKKTWKKPLVVEENFDTWGPYIKKPQGYYRGGFSQEVL